MADDKKYSIISVSTEDEDEYVIHAGAGASTDSPFVREVQSEQASDKFVALPVASYGEGKTDTVTCAGDDADASLVMDSETQQKLIAQKKRAAELEELKQTEESLRSAPMSKMQKIVLSFIVVAIIAFIIYCLFTFVL